MRFFRLWVRRHFDLIEIAAWLRKQSGQDSDLHMMVNPVKQIVRKINVVYTEESYWGKDSMYILTHDRIPPC
ncbi:hypothetical protein BGP75_20300 [Motiliproteus sp. MSK22-1]|nr:hypothetical protein BGP75_20300 [Motiliproteus sp. MSK22-1]